MEYHPFFDTVSCVWVVICGGRCIEAPSIKSMLTKLPPESSVRDYFPSGMPLSLIPRPETATPELRPRLQNLVKNLRRKPTSEPKLPPPPEEPPATKVNRRPPKELGGLCDLDNSILDLWARGFTGPSIAADLRCKVTYVTSWLIPRARQLGDPRAVVRNVKGMKKKPRNGSARSGDA